MGSKCRPKVPCLFECRDKSVMACSQEYAVLDERKVNGKIMRTRKVFRCTRNAGHEGEHVACGRERHNLKNWPGTQAPVHPLALFELLLKQRGIDVYASPAQDQVESGVRFGVPKSVVL